MFYIYIFIYMYIYVCVYMIDKNNEKKPLLGRNMYYKKNINEE